MWDQADFARRVFYCYVVWCNKRQHAREDETTRLDDFGAAVAQLEGRQDPYSASTVGAWMRPGGSVPEPSTVQAIAATGDVDPGWVMFYPNTRAPEPPDFSVQQLSIWPGLRRRRRSKTAPATDAKGAATPDAAEKSLRIVRPHPDAVPER
jgi:hypothetical protein